MAVYLLMFLYEFQIAVALKVSRSGLLVQCDAGVSLHKEPGP